MSLPSTSTTTEIEKLLGLVLFGAFHREMSTILYPGIILTAPVCEQIKDKIYELCESAMSVLL